MPASRRAAATSRVSSKDCREAVHYFLENDPSRVATEQPIEAWLKLEQHDVKQLASRRALGDYELVLAGEGDALPRLKERFAHYPNIRFVGRLDETSLVQLYSSATALLFPSIAPETFGLTAVEAMACGTPAIVRDAGGCAEIIETTNAGFVYRQSSELPALLHRIVREPGLRQRLSELALSGTRKFYTRQRYMDDYLALIDELHGCRQATGDRHLTTPEGQNQ